MADPLVSKGEKTGMAEAEKPALPKPVFVKKTGFKSLRMPGLIGNVLATLTVANTAPGTTSSKISSRDMVQMWDGAAPLIVLNDTTRIDRSSIMLNPGMYLSPDKYFISNYVALDAGLKVPADTLGLKLTIQDHTLSTSRKVTILPGFLFESRRGVTEDSGFFYHFDIEELEEERGMLLIKGYEFALRKGLCAIMKTEFGKPNKVAMKMSINASLRSEDEDEEEEEEDPSLVTPKQLTLENCIACGNFAPFECNCGTVAFCGNECRLSYWNSTHKFECTLTNK